MKVKSRKEWMRSNATNILRVGLVLLFLVLAIYAITLNRYGLVIGNREPWLWLTAALISVGPELAGIVIGVVTIDYLNKRRQEEQLKSQLIRQMGMNIRDVAVPAVKELAYHGWLYDGSLSKAILQGADLNGADLSGANLSGAKLTDANLSGAKLINTNLSGANLDGANLSGATLDRANLSEAELEGADLSGADLAMANLSWINLSRANLREARLWGANLSWANLSEAKLSKAYFSKAYLSGANLSGANLSGADLAMANLSGAALIGADLSGTDNWSFMQLDQALTLERATMPDKVLLGQERTPFQAFRDGPTFKEWKEQYLAKQSGSIFQYRSVNKPYDDRLSLSYSLLTVAQIRTETLSDK